MVDGVDAVGEETPDSSDRYAAPWGHFALCAYASLEEDELDRPLLQKWRFSLCKHYIHRCMTTPGCWSPIVSATSGDVIKLPCGSLGKVTQREGNDVVIAFPSSFVTSSYTQEDLKDVLIWKHLKPKLYLLIVVDFCLNVFENV